MDIDPLYIKLRCLWLLIYSPCYVLQTYFIKLYDICLALLAKPKITVAQILSHPSIEALHQLVGKAVVWLLRRESCKDQISKQP